MIFDKRIAFVSIFISIILIISGYYWLTGIGIGIFVFNLLNFIKVLGKTIPILELMLLVASAQWILGPFFDYSIEVDHYKYKMYVSEIAYMKVVVPSLFCLQLGIMVALRKLNLVIIYNNLISTLKTYKNIPYYLIIFGFIAPYLSLFLPFSFSFVLFLLANLKFIGILYLFFQGKDLRHWSFWVIMGILFLSALQSGMFHDFILWSTIMFSFLVLRFQWSMITRVFLISGGLIFAILIQSIKQDFREKLEINKGKEVSLFFNLLEDKVENNNDFFSEENLDNLNVRLNQGWIISAVIFNIPYYRPYDMGNSIWDAVKNSIVPRFLDPNKMEAGGRENFRNFTGLDIGDNTSMGISIVGEAYGNFGIVGAYIFMFFWGIFISFFFKQLVKFSIKYPTFILWLPLIFLHALKAETEVYVVLNHMIKATVLSVLLFIISYRIVGQKI